MPQPEPQKAEVTQQTKSKVDLAMDGLWNPKLQKTGRAKGRAKKIVTEDKRLHALDSMRCLDNTLRTGLGRRLWQFKFFYCTD